MCIFELIKIKKVHVNEFRDISVKSKDHLYCLPHVLTHNTYTHVVASEVARWEHNPEATLANLKESIPAGGTLDIESTANGWGGYFFEECYSDDTEVLTRKGWKKWNKVKATDEFATRDNRGRFVWQSSTKLHKHFYKGELLNFKGRAVDVLVTPNHRMYGWQTKNHLELITHTTKTHKTGKGASGAPIEFMEAVKIKNLPYWHGKFGFRVPATSIWKGLFPGTYHEETGKIKLESKNGKTHTVDLKDWVSFLGLYIAEGSSSGVCRNMEGKGRGKSFNSVPLYIQAKIAAKDKSPIIPVGRSYSYSVSITQLKKSKHYASIVRLLQRLPFECKRCGNSWYFSDKTLHFILSQCGNCYTKRIPEWVKELPPEYLKLFIKWAVKGDGWKRSDSGTKVYSTASKKLANDMQELFQKIGKYSLLMKIHAKKGRIFGRETQLSDFYWVKENVKDYQSLGKPKKVAYSGYVYCATVPNGTLYVRRNGKPLWCGNCMRARDTEKPYREFKYHFQQYDESK